MLAISNPTHIQLKIHCPNGTDSILVHLDLSRHALLEILFVKETVGIKLFKHSVDFNQLYKDLPQNLSMPERRYSSYIPFMYNIV